MPHGMPLRMLPFNWEGVSPEGFLIMTYITTCYVQLCTCISVDLQALIYSKPILYTHVCPAPFLMLRSVIRVFVIVVGAHEIV